MTIGAVYLNDRDVETDFSLYVGGLSGWPGNLGSAPRAVPLIGGPSMHGAIIDPSTMVRTPGNGTITGLIMTASPALAIAALDALRELVSGGEVAVRTFYASDRQCFAVLTGFEGNANQPEVLDGNVKIAMTFVVKDGVAKRLVPDGYSLTARVSCPIGTAESRPMITIHGGGASLTNPTITVKNAAGEVKQSMTLTVVLASTDVLLVDCERNLISVISSGVSANGMSYWLSNSGDFPVLRPSDGFISAAAYPSVELSASAGAAQGDISYTRAWV